MRQSYNLQSTESTECTECIHLNVLDVVALNKIVRHRNANKSLQSIYRDLLSTKQIVFNIFSF